MFGNFRGGENGEKRKKSPHGPSWGVIDKSVPGRGKSRNIDVKIFS